MNELRQFLYITPYFPPLCRVGALRPLKFCRHIQRFGWRPIVLCDFHPSDRLDASLLAALPPQLEIHRTYSRFADGFDPEGVPAPGESLGGRPPYRLLKKFPLGRHSPDIPHALAQGSSILRNSPCEAIVVNADPFASLLVGAELARRFGLPLISDLRDPWAICEMRRPRHALPRWCVDKLETHVIRGSSRVLLNTEKALSDYRLQYPDHVKKLAMLRNHCDTDLISAANPIQFDRFTALFLGSLRKFLRGDPLVEMLKALQMRNIAPAQFQLALPEAAAQSLRQRAPEAGIGDYIRGIPYTPYQQIGAVMRASDLLISLSNASTQRIPAKLFDYLNAERPIISLADSAEVKKIAGSAQDVHSIGISDTNTFVSLVESAVKKGRGQHVLRPSAFPSRDASQKLGRHLDAVALRSRT